MAPEVVSFIAGAYALIENTRMVCIHLGDSWTHLFGEEPDFSASGSGVVGRHVARSNPTERSLRFSHSASHEAVLHAAGLIKLKYGLETVRVTGRLRATAEGNGWIPRLNPAPPDVTLLTVWPKESGHNVKDGIVLELAGERGHFVHRAREERGRPRTSAQIS